MRVPAKKHQKTVKSDSNLSFTKFKRSFRRALQNPTVLFFLGCGIFVGIKQWPVIRRKYLLGARHFSAGESFNGKPFAGSNLGLAQPVFGGEMSGPVVTEEPESCSIDEFMELNPAGNATDGTTDDDDPVFLFFQKHPRVASSLFVELLGNLAETNGFRYIDSAKKVNSKRRNIDHSDRITDYLKTKNCATGESPLLYSDHNVWIDFNERNMVQPKFITFIRNPVDEFISEYYYCRFGTTGRPQYRTSDCKTMSMKKLKIDPAECMNNYSKFVKNCIQPHPTQLTDRLCGLEDKCNMGEPTSSHNFQKVMAIELTKNRIMQNFAFVGITDHMILSLQVLENVAPRFFKNVIQKS